MGDHNYVYSASTSNSNNPYFCPLNGRSQLLPQNFSTANHYKTSVTQQPVRSMESSNGLRTNDKIRISTKNGVVLQHKAKGLVGTENSPKTTAIISQIRAFTGGQLPSTQQSSLTSSKRKNIRTCTGLNATSSSLTKYNFPPPPKKMEFKVATKTQFGTAVDVDSSPTTTKIIPGPAQSFSDHFEQNSLEHQSNGVPQDCQSIRNVKINVNTMAQTPSDASMSEAVSHVSRVPRIIPKLIRKPPTISSSLFDDDHYLHDEFQDEDAEESVDNNLSALVDVNAPAVMDNNATTAPNDIIANLLKRVQNVEKGQIASARQGSEVLIAVKKMGKNFARFVGSVDDNNDDLRKLLPIKKNEVFIRFDQRLVDDPDYRKKVLLYLRGYKGSDVPKDFTSVLKKVMKDELIFEFNLRGIKGKRCLNDFAVMDVIHDIYKPMDVETFTEKMQKTLEMAKNRQNNVKYRERQRQKYTNL